MLSAPTRQISFRSPMKISDTKRLVRWHEPFLYSGWLQISYIFAEILSSRYTDDIIVLTINLRKITVIRG